MVSRESGAVRIQYGAGLRAGPSRGPM